MESDEDSRRVTWPDQRIGSSNGVSNSRSDDNERDARPGDNNDNNYISISDNNFNGDIKDGDSNNCDGSWGTWEELVLASAVKRHGSENWEAVAVEVQARTALHISSSATADDCRRKYSDLRLRFNGDEVAGGGVPWLEELRRLRVAELKEEVQRYDDSILSLRLKVKRLEEEREKGNDVAGEKRRVQSSDLERSETDKPEENKAAAAEDEERSVNESNSTGPAARKKPDGGEDGGPDPDAKEREKNEADGGRGRDSVSGEAESSASLGRGKKERTRRRGRIRSGSRDQVGPGKGKSEPLVSLLEMIRAHRHGSVFLDRLPIQETDAYKNLVRQHLDVETIELKLEQGSYSSHFAFYRDLLLLFSNAVVFFPKTSTEFSAAQELRSLVLNEMMNEGQKSDSTLAPSSVSVEVKSELQKPDSLLNKHKVSVPTLIACRKRSSMVGKPLPPSSGQKIEQQGQQKSNGSKSVSDLKPPVVELKLKSEDKPVTGTRTSRRSNKAAVKANSSPVKMHTSPTQKIDKPEGSKSDKKKPEAVAGDKKRSVADFLKRIKTSSPVAAVKKNSRGGSSSGDRKDNNCRELAKEKEKTLRKSSDRRSTKDESTPPKPTNGKTQKKAPETRSASASGKRGRDTARKEAAKTPKKRAKR